MFKRGKQAALVADLTDDIRKMMEPYTARNLREQKNNRMKDFLHVSGPLGVTHFIIMSATEQSRYMRIAKTPRGPTLTFRISEYALMRDVAASQRKPRNPESAYKNPPLVVLNNFGSEQHMRLATVTLQNLFPAINVKTVKLASCQRVVLVDCDKETGKMSLRQFSVSATPAGAHRRIKRMLVRREAPDLSSLQDVSEYLMRNAMSDSESEGEDAQAAPRVTLAQVWAHTLTEQYKNTACFHRFSVFIH